MNDRVESEEFFDVVDSFDKVVGVRSRSEVHRLRLLHRAVHVFLFRSDGRMLIHKRTDTKEEFPSVWTSSASGHVESGEAYQQAAERELEEELGIDCQLSRALKVDACEDTSFEFTELFVAESDDPVVPDPAEIAAVDWLTIPEICEQITERSRFSPAFLLLFKQWHAANVDRD